MDTAKYREGVDPPYNMGVEDRESKTKKGIKCLLCGDIIVSLRYRVFMSCACESCYVDSSEAYMRAEGKAGFEIVDVDIAEYRSMIEKRKRKKAKNDTSKY